jgi:NAD(P)-dependent dehydrogenase (short-subunit alcohol dehydrogenase family)
MFDLSGKTALVTGATGGIGGDIARALHAQGAHVVASGTAQRPWRPWRPRWASASRSSPATFPTTPTSTA